MKQTLPAVLLSASSLLLCDSSVFSGEDVADNLPKATIHVQSVRLSRDNTNIGPLFGNRFYADTPGISLQMILTLDRGSMLALDPGALQIETFVDDTYNNLIS